MATYKEIIGTNVETRSSDPSNPVEGQVWYNSTTGALKGASVTTSGSWSSGGSLNTGRAYVGATGIQTAAIAAGGFTYPPGTIQDNVEQYNGTSWTEVADLNTARWQLATGGTYTSAIGFGGATDFPAGSAIANAESWNGSSWTEVSDLNQARRLLSGVGASSTSALAFSGFNPNPAFYNLTETWNGSSWTEVGDLNTARRATGSTGNATAALAIGGENNGASATESWNGSAWTTLPATLNTGRGSAGSSKISTTSALLFGGDIESGRTGITELYNGSSWTEVADLSQVRRNLGGAGADNSSALAFGGEIAPTTAVTEEWLGAGATLTRTFTTS